MLMRVLMYRLTQLPTSPMEKEPMNRNICASMMFTINPMLRMPMPSSTMACVRKGVTSDSIRPASMPSADCASSRRKGHTYFRPKRMKLCFSFTGFLRWKSSVGSMAMTTPFSPLSQNLANASSLNVCCP